MAGLARTKLIVATDEPTSLTDAYAFIKLAHMQDPQVGTGGPDLRIVINMAASPAEGARTYATLLTACESFLKISHRLAGVIRRDRQVKDAIRHTTTINTRHPHRLAAAAPNPLAGGLAPRAEPGTARLTVLFISPR